MLQLTDRIIELSFLQSEFGKDQAKPGGLGGGPPDSRESPEAVRSQQESGSPVMVLSPEADPDQDG